MHADVARETLELLGEAQELAHFLFGGFALVDQRLHVARIDDVRLRFGVALAALERDHPARLKRNQLGDAVAEGIGQVEHPADVAHDRLGRHGAEGHDLRHRFGAVLLLDVVDDAIAAVLAEVDVEVRHRHPLGIQEALEQQRVAQRIEIGDAEAVRHQRAGAGAAPGADRNAIALGPIDEVGDDQEVSGVSHLDDGLHLELEAGDVFRPHALALGGLGKCDVQAPLQADARLAVQMLLQRHAFRRRKRGQIILAQRQRQIATLGDRHAVRQSAGQVRKTLRHFVLRREVLLRREAFRPPRIGKDVALGDAHAGFVRPELGTGRKLHRVGRDDRQRKLRREPHGGGGQGVVVAAAGALHFEIEAIRKKPRPRVGRGARRHRAALRSAWPTSPPANPDSAIKPSVPSANQARFISARPRYWLVR